jgi:hypothetical protein
MSGAGAGLDPRAVESGEEVRPGESTSPTGYNIGVNVGAAAGQSRMHVHVPP